MKIFVMAHYSTKVNYDTGEVYPEYKAWLEELLTSVEEAGYEVFCALRADGYKINDADPAAAYQLDMDNIENSDVILALLDETISAGTQTEIGFAVAKGKQVILAHEPDHKLRYFNAAMIRAGVVDELVLPITPEKLRPLIGELTTTQ